MFFKDYAKLFLKINKNHYKASSYDKIKGIIKNRLYIFFDMRLEDIKSSLIKDWIFNIKGVSVKSKKHYLSVLSLILELAKEDNVIALILPVRLNCLCIKRLR